MVRLRQSLLLLAANLLIPVGILIFMTGYFRGRPRMLTPAGVDMGEPERATSKPAPFDKVVFMIVDSLRSDFVYAENTGFTFTQSLIRSGAAIPFTALATVPTLTVSRLKALTQGTSQSFLDAWLNVANSPDAIRLEGEDTWLSRLKAERGLKKKLVYYGIDVWLDLYPDIFDRHEGFFSFYIPDVTTVDEGVTRRALDELQNDDWNALVLHYLGLDCLAHLGGPRSAHMLPKQVEMDDIVQQIYEAIEHKPHLQNTLFVLLGDHGMTERGNHGGDSPGEVASAMTFMSPRFKSISRGLESPVTATKNYKYYSVINQVDLVPTLAGLLGFSIPARNVGIFIPEFLEVFQNVDDGLQILLENAKQMMKAFEMENDVTAVDSTSCSSHCGGCRSEESQVVCLWEKVMHAEQEWKTSQNTSNEELKQAIRVFCDSAQQGLSVPLNNLSFLRLFVGISCLAALMLLLLKSYSLSEAPWDSGSLILGTVTTLYGGTMFISRLVEEEHHYWYWTSLAWLGYLGFKRVARGERWLKAACPVALQFLGQCLNQTGTQSSVARYIDDFLLDYPILLWVSGSITHVSAAGTMSKYLGMGSLASLVASCALCCGAIVFKICSTHNFNPELLNFAPLWLKDIMAGIDYNYTLRIFWTGLVACFVYFLLQFKFSGRVSRKVTMIRILELANLYLRSQTRPKNLVLFHIFELQLQWLLSPGIELEPSEISVTTLLLGQSSFYAMGRDNSFASLDLMNGYNGLDGSSVVPVMLQTIISNWIGPVWWSLASLRMLLVFLEARNAPTATQSEKGGIAPAKCTLNGTVEENGTSYLNGKGQTNGNGAENGRIRDSIIDGGTVPGRANKTEHVIQARRPFFEHLTLQTVFTASSSLAVMLACIWLRDDPTLWTVLAPKYVNVALWAAFHHVLINVVLCTGIWVVIAR